MPHTLLIVGAAPTMPGSVSRLAPPLCARACMHSHATLHFCCRRCRWSNGIGAITATTPESDAFRTATRLVKPLAALSICPVRPILQQKAMHRLFICFRPGINQPCAHSHQSRLVRSEQLRTRAAPEQSCAQLMPLDVQARRSEHPLYSIAPVMSEAHPIPECPNVRALTRIVRPRLTDSVHRKRH
jgi:hypothetical protein